MSQYCTILYGKHVAPDAWLDPDEVFRSPDPDDPTRLFVLVWRDDATCAAFIRNAGHVGVAVTRQVSVEALKAFAAELGLHLAMDTDEYGGSRHLVTPSRGAIEVDADVNSPPDFPPGWTLTHNILTLWLVGAALKGPVAAIEAGVAGEQIELSGSGPEFTEGLLADCLAYIEAARRAGGTETVLLVGLTLFELLPRHLDGSALPHIARSLIAVITATGNATGQQVAYLEALERAWGLQRM